VWHEAKTVGGDSWGDWERATGQVWRLADAATRMHSLADAEMVGCRDSQMRRIVDAQIADAEIH
jgi:hypothetical protein